LKRTLVLLPIAMCFLLAIAFSIKSLREPDLWWQIRTGEWILENGKIPTQDVFSYTYAGHEWINVKWGFEVLAALITKAAGPECIFILQIIASCLLIFFLMKAAQAFAEKFNLNTFYITLPVALFITLIASEYRINGRPEMVSHFMTALFLFLLIKNRQSPTKALYALIPLQILWANFHEAFGIGIVLISIFSVAAWVQYAWKRKNSPKDVPEMPKQLSIVLLAAVAGIIINPQGYKLLLRPFSLLGQVYENKYTTELFDFTTREYWAKEPYIAFAMLAVTLLAMGFYVYKNKAKETKPNLFINNFGFGYLLTLLAFTYLALTAYRNVMFLAIVCMPGFAWALSYWLESTASIKKILQSGNVPTAKVIGFSVFVFAVYISVVSGKYYEWTKSRDKFGLQVLATFNPSGAADFVKQKNLKGTCFSDYLTSSYLLWKLQPEFKTYIDLRDLDVFPTEFFSTFATTVTFPDSFEAQNKKYNFDYVVLYRVQFQNLHRYLYNQSNYKLAYVDPVAAVYTKKTESDTLNTEVFAPSRAIDVSLPATIINKIFNPFFKADDYKEMNYNILAASYYLPVGDFAKAKNYAINTVNDPKENYKGYEVLGEIYYNRALTSMDAEQRKGLLDTSLTYFNSSLALKPDFALAHLGKGALQFQMQNYQGALESFDKCVAADPENLNGHLFAAECCKFFANQNTPESGDYVNKAIAHYKAADKLNPDNPAITLNTGLLYCRLNDCENSTKYLNKVVGYPGLTEQEKASANECLRRCGK
jgi:tetratricopeptide (TPR) repeat protein